jgi:hypothetical protein
MACFILSLVFHRKFKKHKISLAIPAAICFIAANLLQKNALISARHWLFFLPAFLMITGSGLFLIIKAIQEKTGFVRLFVFPALSVVISLGLCFSVYFSQSVLKSDETGVFREGESVVDYLYNEYSKNDIIIAPDYMTQPVLFYYLDRHNLQGLCFSVKEVFNKQGSYGNIYILVSKDQKLYDLMDFYLLQNIRKNPAEKLKTFGPYCLYKI